MPVVGAPSVDAALTGGALVLAGALFSVPGLVGYVLESAVVALSDRLPRRALVASALVCMSVSLALAAILPGAAGIAIALGVWGTAAGIAEGVAETALVLDQEHPERIMTRWALSGAVGDLLAPILLAIGLSTGASWRTILLLTAALPLLDALAVALGPPLAAPEEDEDAEPLWTALRGLATDRVLLGWLLATTSCVLLDELLVMLMALRLDALGASPLAQSASLALLAAGLATGLIASERHALDRYGARRVLLGGCALAAVALLGWIAAGASLWGAPCALALGLGVGPMWPLCMAAAYARRPDRPGLIAAVDSVVSLPELAAPLLVAFVAERWGTGAALVVLLLQPALIAAMALRLPSPASAPPPTGPA